jgi:pimeloyl-ACP methyl ester carboxylesterase
VLDNSAEFSIPNPAEIVLQIMRDGAEIRLRRYGNPGSTRLVLSHGNGLAINSYAPFWLPLAEQFDVIVFDVRNHGENARHEPDRHRMDVIAEDFEEIFQAIQKHFGSAPTVGVFHSLSAIASLQHALKYGRRWAALALFDPPIYPMDGHPLQVEHMADMTAHIQRTNRRPQRYDRPENFARQLARRPAFARLVPEGAMLLARHTLRAAPEGGWELSNPRELEARIFEAQNDATLWPRMRALTIPVILICGDPALPETSPATRVAAAIHDDLGIEYVSIPQTTHFLQIEKPQACREALISFLDKHGFLRSEAATAHGPPPP